MKKETLLIGLAALLFPNGAMAQYTIYPIPQEQIAGTGTASFTATVTVVCEEGIDQYTRNRAEQVLKEHGLKVEFSKTASDTNSNLYLGINGSHGTADAIADALKLSKEVFTKEGKFDRHILSLSDAGNGRAQIVALGENTDAAFFALASLEQIFDKGTQNLACVTLNDFADQKSRGIVEGYYGYPYSVSVKKDLMRYMMRYKMNTYLYGAKSDPYHSQKWKEAYPTTITEEQKKNGWLTQDMVKEVTETSHQTKVNFIWAIHPGNDFVNRASTVDDIMSKYDKMHKLGVRQFAVFVDDVSIPQSDADLKANADHLTALQKAIEKKWNYKGAEANDTVRPIHFVPQIYCTGFKPSWEVHNKFFNELSRTPSYITIYTTGGGVWSVPNSYDFQVPKDQLHRPLAWWWNYPCNDNADGQIYPMDMYSNFYDMPAVDNNARLPRELNHGLGIVSNPMQQGEVAKTPLFSVADYAWNTSGFDNKTSWEASFKAVLPGNEPAQKAYRYLAEYLRYNDPQELADMIASFKSTHNAAELSARMEEIVRNCNELVKLKDSQIEGEALLYKDLSPWLLKLRAMAEVTKDLLNNASSKSKEDSRWTEYVGNLHDIESLSTAEEYKAYALEGMGSGISTSVRPSQPSQRTLLPFVDYMKMNALNGFFEQKDIQNRPVFVSNNEDIHGNVSGSSTIYMTQPKPCSLKKGDWVGIQLVHPVRVQNISVADTLAEKFSVVISADGKQWSKIGAGDNHPEEFVRFAGVLNENEETKSVKMGPKSIRIIMPAKTQVRESTIPEGNVWDNHTKNLMHDGNYSTFVCLHRNQQNGDAYMLKLNKKQPIYMVKVGMGTTNGDHMNEARIQISEDGTKWKDLKVKGTSSPVFTMSIPQVRPYSDEVKTCEFDGEEKEALYVRLYVNKANTNKWLRLYEIEVNGESSYTLFDCYDTANTPIEEVSDGNPSTSSARAAKVGNKGELTYYFQNYQLLNGVTVYCDPATMKQTKVATSMDLKEWTRLDANAESGVMHLSFADEAQQSSALRFTWTGTTTPAIYEIIENENAEKKPVVTEIVQINGTDASAAVVKVENGRLIAESAVGIRHIEVFTLDGKKLIEQTLQGTSKAVLPLITSVKQPLIVTVILENGNRSSYKVM